MLLGGTTYVGDVLIEYLRFEYYKNGSDYARGFLQEKFGGGWLEEGVNQAAKVITEADFMDIKRFMEPIHDHHRKLDKQRELELNDLRSKKEMIAKSKKA